MKVNLYVMGQYRGEIEVGEKSIVGRAVSGDITGAMKGAAALQNEINMISSGKEFQTAAIFETFDDDSNDVAYRIEFDGEEFPRLFKRRCDATRFANKRAQKVDQWYSMDPF